MESSEAGGILCRVNGTLVHELSHGPTYLQSMVLEPKFRVPTRDPRVSILKSNNFQWLNGTIVPPSDDPMYVLINWE